MQVWTIKMCFTATLSALMHVEKSRLRTSENRLLSGAVRT